MFKSLAFECFRRAGHSIRPKQFAGVQTNGVLVRPFVSSEANLNLYHPCSPKLSFLSRYSTMTDHAQITWKSFSRICPYSGPAFSRRTMLAYATGHTIALGFYSFMVCVMLSKRRAWASGGGNYVPKTNTLDIQTQTREACFTSLILSVLEHLVLLTRAIYLGILFSPTVALAPFANSFGVKFRKLWIRLFHGTLEKAGPVFIAWGQWAATRPDLFPRDLCVELSKLRSNVPEHSFSYTRKTIEKAFGRKLPEIFDDFEEAPVESGIISQVHRATLRSRYAGHAVKPIQVSVKVRHPRIRGSFEVDFAILQSFAKLVGIVPSLKWLRLDEHAQQFRAQMAYKINLYSEAMVLSQFNYTFRRFNDVFFSKPLYPLVHPDVSVETYDNRGRSLSRYIDDKRLLREYKESLVYAGTRALIQMFVVENFFHAGMHPENIIIQFRKGRPCVVFRDVGMTAAISDSELNNFIKVVQAVGARDGRTAAEYVLRLSKNQRCPCPDSFIEDMENSFAFWDTREGGSLSPLECMKQLLEKVRCHKVNIDDNISVAIMSVVALEGWQRKFFLSSRQRVMTSFHYIPTPDTIPGIPRYGPRWKTERGRLSFFALD